MRKVDVLKHFNNKQEAICKLLDITSGAIPQWGEIIPKARALELEKLTGGALTYDPSYYRRSKAA